MSKKKKNKLTPEEKKVRKSKKLYRLKIGHLAYKTCQGDLVAEKKLEIELAGNPAARLILESIARSKSLARYAPKSKSQGQFAMARPSSGNAFRMYDGGAPGLGRRS